MTTLQNMTQERWNACTPAERDALRSDGGLTRQLIGLEGWRVEVVNAAGVKRRFIVGRSSGWIPCHTELKTVNSSGGYPADSTYASVRKLYKVR